ncbi:halocin C8-like domain-containing protein [Methanosarcina sp. WWM596]|uniref:halocin C8-like domain-containing protein n=1 Tax=Methanosarcina sp. WWM596 TaxID=1434103 RepID=UPI000615BDFD|nr:halocin C8-like domain-containing protein [Methanosarcina sp. WWM596]AKB18219.1 hypothetical protein MSWHS_1356 [Methanosarcina sp. WWM596]
MKLNSKARKISGLFMIMLVVGMMLVTPAIACPAGTNCSQTSTDCTTCGNFGNLSNITKLDSNKVEEGVQTALESDDVKRLIKKLDSKGYKLNQTEIAGMGATLNNETYYEAVGLTLDSKHNSTGALIAVFENDEIIKVRAQIVERDETGYPLSVEILTVNGNTIVSESGEVSDILNGKTKASLISSAALAPITPRAMDACTACKLLAEGACNIGCGLEMAIFCALLGIPAIVGGLTCAAIATMVCFVVGEFGCEPTALDLCREAGYC